MSGNSNPNPRILCISVQHRSAIKVSLHNHLEMFVHQCTTPLNRAQTHNAILFKLTSNLTSMSTLPTAIVTKASIHVKHVLVFSSPWEQAKSRILVCILTISKYKIPTIYKQHNIKQRQQSTMLSSLSCKSPPLSCVGWSPTYDHSMGISQILCLR